MSPRAPEETQRIREERQTQILAAASELFAEKGFHDTKVSEIAARAGVSQGTVYWYFDSKDALFEATFKSQFETFVQPLYEIVADDGRSAVDKLMDIAGASIDLFADNIDLVFVMLQVMATQEVASIITHDFREYYDQFKVFLTPLFEELGDPDPAATTSMYMAVLDGLMLQCLFGPDWFDRDHVLAQIQEKFNLKEG
ncbi:MAG: TetR/AcrR family transcriptional regulator [Anaerolineae bacterium]